MILGVAALLFMVACAHRDLKWDALTEGDKELAKIARRRVEKLHKWAGVRFQGVLEYPLIGKHRIFAFVCRTGRGVLAPPSTIRISIGIGPDRKPLVLEKPTEFNQLIRAEGILLQDSDQALNLLLWWEKEINGVSVIETTEDTVAFRQSVGSALEAYEGWARQSEQFPGYHGEITPTVIDQTDGYSISYLCEHRQIWILMPPALSVAHNVVRVNEIGELLWKAQKAEFVEHDGRHELAFVDRFYVYENRCIPLWNELTEDERELFERAVDALASQASCFLGEYRHLADVVESPLIRKHKIFVLSDLSVQSSGSQAVAVNIESRNTIVLGAWLKTELTFSTLLRDEEISVQNKLQALDAAMLYLETLPRHPMMGEMVVLKGASHLAEVAGISPSELGGELRGLIQPVSIREERGSFRITLFIWQEGLVWGKLERWTILVSRKGRLSTSKQSVAQIRVRGLLGKK